MGLSTVVVLLMSVWLSNAEYSTLDWSDCGSDPSFTISRLEVTPMPVVVPGTIQLTIEGQVNRSLGDIQLELDVKRETFLLDLPIPCLFHLGSCTYDSSCSADGPTVVNTMISEDWGGIMGDIGGQIKNMLRLVPGLNSSTCPYPASPVNIQQYTLNLPEIPSILSFIAEGDYSIRAVARDSATHQTLLCLHLGVTLQEKEEPCTGLFCGR